MVSLRKCQRLYGLAIVLICVPALCQESNQPKIELRFEISREEQQWITDQGRAGRLPSA